jgi:hypothetical protein
MFVKYKTIAPQRILMINLIRLTGIKPKVLSDNHNFGLIWSF